MFSRNADRAHRSLMDDAFERGIVSVRNVVDEEIAFFPVRILVASLPVDRAMGFHDVDAARLKDKLDAIRAANGLDTAKHVLSYYHREAGGERAWFRRVSTSVDFEVALIDMASALEPGAPQMQFVFFYTRPDEEALRHERAAQDESPT